VAFFNGDELRQVYHQAMVGRYAFMANNITESNILIGLLEAYTEKRSDLIVQVSPEALEFIGGGDKLVGLDVISYTVRRLGDCYPIGVFLNLDHFTVKDMDLIKEAVEKRLVSSIMIDASDKTFEENVQISREVVEMAKNRGILVEAELGRIKGAEDDVTSDEVFYTKPDDAGEFVERTAVDLLAISVGTQHGVSKGRDVVLRMDIARQIRDRLVENDLLVPLVLHGTSGLLPDQIREIIRCGVCKLNISTLYQYEYTRAAFEFYARHASSILPPADVADDAISFFSETDWKPKQSIIDLHAVGNLIRTRIKRVSMRLIDIVGSANKTILGTYPGEA